LQFVLHDLRLRGCPERLRASDSGRDAWRPYALTTAEGIKSVWRISEPLLQNPPPPFLYSQGILGT
jgi:hypothetical protein